MDAPRGLGSQDRPLPTAEAELGQLVNIQIGRDLTRLLGHFQALGVPFAPDLEDLFETGPEGLALIGQLLAQIAHQTAVATLLRPEPRADLLEVTPEPTQRTEARVPEAALEIRPEVLGEPAQYLKTEILLASEVVIKRPLGHIRLLEDVLDPGIGITPFEENTLPRF